MFMSCEERCGHQRLQEDKCFFLHLALENVLTCALTTDQ